MKDLYETPTYRSWKSMKSRCNNPNHKSYSSYGGAGIRYCVEWEAFEGFYKSMGIRPEGKTLDRKVGTLGYFEGNCRWVTYSEQTQNTKRKSNSGYKYIFCKTPGKEYVVLVRPFSSKYANTLSNAKKLKLKLLELKNLITFKEGTMQPESFKVSRRRPEEQYGYTEVEISGSFTPGDNVYAIIVNAKSNLEKALKADYVTPTPIIHVGEEETAEQAPTKVPVKPTVKKEEVKKEEVKKEEVKKEEVKVEKKTKKKVVKKKVVKKSACVPYDREQQAHKDDFAAILNEKCDGWKAVKGGTKLAKEASLALNGVEMFGPDGNVLGDFEDKVYALLAPALETEL